MIKTKVIAVTNMKGGVGKTTTAGVLAHGLARKLADSAGAMRGYVVAVDLDPQGNLADYFGVRDLVYDKSRNPSGACISRLLTQQATLKDTLVKLDRPQDGLARPNLFLIPASRALERAAEYLLLADYQNRRHPDSDSPALEDILAHYLAPLLGRASFIVIDTPPKLDIFKPAVYRFADEVIVPTRPDHLSLVGCVQHTNDMDEYVREGAKASLRFVVPTMAIGRQLMDKAMMDNLLAAYGARRIADPIPQAVVVKESSGSGGRTLFEYAEANHPARVAYQSLVDRIYAEAL